MLSENNLEKFKKYNVFKIKRTKAAEKLKLI